MAYQQPNSPSAPAPAATDTGQQQFPNAYDPTHYSGAWNEMTPQAALDHFQGNLHDDSVTTFLHQHPNFFRVLFRKQLQFSEVAFCTFMTKYGFADHFLYDIERSAADPQQAANAARLTRQKVAIQHCIEIARGRDMPSLGVWEDEDGADGNFVDASAVVDLDSEHFMDELIGNIATMHQANHNIALQYGYGHAYNGDNGQAWTTAWGTTWQNGWQQDGQGQVVTDQYGRPIPQTQFTPHAQNPYGQQHYPQQPPNGMQNPHMQNGGLTGTLIGLGANYLMSGM
jgi:hypothetical protein